MDAEAGEAASTLRPPARRKIRKRAPLLRLYRLLVSRLSTPLLTSLILLPILPSTNRHVLFELLPFYKSLRCLVSTPSHASSTHACHRSMQQWLSYWTVYTFVRFLEATRCNVSTGSQRRKALQYALDRLPRMLGERILRLFSFARRKSASPSTAVSVLPRDMTLATQLAGSSTRWTVIKAIVLFYAMDEELQGARRIMQKLIKPFFAFFTSLDEDDYDEGTAMYRNPQKHAIIRTLEEEEQAERSRAESTLSLEDKQDATTHQDEHIYTPGTPALSMDGSSGRSDEEQHVEAMYGLQNTIIVEQDMRGKDHFATWPFETRLIAVQSHDNHWVR